MAGETKKATKSTAKKGAGKPPNDYRGYFRDIAADFRLGGAGG